MPKISQRDALDTLRRNRLHDLAQGFELDTANRRTKDELVEILASSHRASLERILGALKLPELKPAEARR